MKRIFLMASIMTCSVNVFAQHNVGAITVEPKAGLNIANITDARDSKLRIGMAFGAELRYQFKERLGFSAGIIYSQQGAKYEESEHFYWFDEEQRVDYLNVPIMVNYYVLKGLAVKVGLQPAFKVYSKYKGNGKGYIDFIEYLQLLKLKNNTKVFDFSIPIGLSYEYKNFIIEGRYNIGLTKMMKHDYEFQYGCIVDEIKRSSCNRVLQLTLGYKFKL